MNIFTELRGAPLTRATLENKIAELVSVFEEDLQEHVFGLLDSLGFVGWACCVCGQPGVKSPGSEGYCHKHRPPTGRGEKFTLEEK